MMSTAFYLAGLYLISTTYSGCIPANSCFQQIIGNSDSMFDSSYKFTCSNNVVKKTKYEGSTDCKSGASTTTLSSGGTISAGDKVPGSASGSISVDYLQGEGCPTLNKKSEDCSDFMVLKHYGDLGYVKPNGAEFPYGDIGDNCSNKGSLYSSITIPTGCVNLFTGSVFYECTATSWSYTYYSLKNCQGNILSAQTDAFDVGKCSKFEEWTHCQDGTTTGCTGSGVLQSWYYYYDLVCCPINGKTCTGVSSSSGSSTVPSGGNPQNPAPTRAPTKPTTAAPTKQTQAPVPTAPTLSTTSSPTPTESAPGGGGGKGGSDMRCIIYGVFMVIGVMMNM